MLNHNKCGQHVYLDLSRMYKLVATFGIYSDQISISQGDVISIKNEAPVSPEFYCPCCQETVQAKDLVSFCFHCGAIYSVEDLVKPTDSGGLYCIGCANSLEISVVQLDSILHF